MNKNLFLIVLSFCFLAGSSPSKEVENIQSEEIHKYTKKVLIDTKWGDKPGEFGMNIYNSPPSGPGNLVIDNDNLYIYDYANNRVYKYDSIGILQRVLQSKIDDDEGNAEKKEIINFTVKDDTLYGVVFPVSEGIEEIAIINTETGEKIGIAEVCFWESYPILNVEKNNERIVLTRGREKRYKLEVNYEQGYMFLKTPEISSKDFGEFKKKDKKKGYLYVRRQKFIISNAKGGSIYNAEKLAEDKDENIYIIVWSSNPLGSPSPRNFVQVYKFSNEGRKLATVDLPLGGVSGIDPKISEKGDIYYLYATGEIIEKDWKISFVPGKVQLIKWELER